MGAFNLRGSSNDGPSGGPGHLRPTSVWAVGWWVSEGSVYESSNKDVPIVRADPKPLHLFALAVALDLDLDDHVQPEWRPSVTAEVNEDSAAITNSGPLLVASKTQCVAPPEASTS
jgi:hypothetical protein